MKRINKLFFAMVFLFYQNSADAQKSKPSKMFRVYEENDFFDVRGHGTDKAYSNGTRLDFFYEKQKTHGWLHKIMPKAGDSSKNVYGWSLMQIMVTPHDIATVGYIPNDFYYAGALFVTHSLYSYNPKKKFGFQTELMAGIRGPASFAKEVQRGFHKLVGDQEPMGWDNQLKTQPLINITVGAEKNIFSIHDFLELNVGSQARVGSMMDLVMFYPMLRIGKMSPYFDGFMSQYGSFKKNGGQVKKTQYYFVVKPAMWFIAYNAMLKGERRNLDKEFYGYSIEEGSPSLRNHVMEIQFGAVVAHGNFAISFMQSNTSAYNEGIDRHSFGNLSLHFRW